MTTLGELTKLLEQGYLSGDYTFESPAGNYKFELKTVSPLEEIESWNDADKRYAENPADYEKNVYIAIETLARSVTTVNGVAFEQVPGAEGSDSLAKKRSLLKKFSSKLLAGLWGKYQEIQKGTQLDGSKEEAEAIKK